MLEGIERVLSAAGLSAADVGMIHGTTLATSAVIERRGAATAVITTEGFRDVLAIADEGRFNQYDINLVKTEPLVPRYRRLLVPERTSADGEGLIPLKEAAVRALVPELVRTRSRERCDRLSPLLRRSGASVALRRDPARSIAGALDHPIQRGLPGNP